MDVTIIIFTVMTVILFFGMIADRDAENRRNFSQAFMVAIVAVVVLKLLSKF